jgi:hypothetical protein
MPASVQPLLTTTPPVQQITHKHVRNTWPTYSSIYTVYIHGGLLATALALKATGGNHSRPGLLTDSKLPFV